MTRGVCIIGTGGTFDKVYNFVSELMDFSEGSAIPDILRLALISEASFQSIMEVDSLEMTEEQRESLIRFISTSPYSKFVVVHGTSRMVESAKLVKKRTLDAVIVFTGALRPYRYEPVEASANLSASISAARCLESGTHIFMNGKLFDPENCHKNLETGLFERVR